MIMADALKEMKDTKGSRPQLAEVVEVTTKGVKLRIFGEEDARQTYYNSIANVSVGNKVYINYIGDTILVIGKLIY